ncbi:type 1 glutamine amidotransferase [Isoptericola hypogeus]|uniref:Type 1 glutamine amidotransferase n=1 Tax=Isoptericola hypogeus TaxID=300179 RepID=A0ABP4VPH4_9MICO
MTRPTVVLVQNSPTSGPGRLPGWLTEAGIDARVVQGAELAARVPGLGAAFSGDPATGTASGERPTPVDGLVLLGGGLLPDEDERAPWLPHERRLAGAALAAGVPVLGICLGGQLLAHVTGGQVTARSGETEKGLCTVRLLPAAGDDPLLGPLAALLADPSAGQPAGQPADPSAGQPAGQPAGPSGIDGLRMVESHVDSITGLPPQAVHLATNDACRVQAFRVGDAAWGLQFHPEADPARIGTWDAEELAKLGFDRDALHAAALEGAAENEAQARALADAFAAVVHRRCEHDFGPHSRREPGQNHAHNDAGVGR